MADQDPLAALIDSVARRERTITVYGPTPPSATLREHFEPAGVTVEHVRLPEGIAAPFLTVRVDGEFRGAVRATGLAMLEDPPARPVIQGGDETRSFRALLDLLADTTFVGFDRSQMLMTAREIEERAWRVGDGTLHTGFQSSAALAAQRTVYERLATASGLQLELYVRAESPPQLAGATVHRLASRANEWFVVFDATDETQSCGMVGTERAEGFTGFWTYDPALVREIVAALEELVVDTEGSG